MEVRVVASCSAVVPSTVIAAAAVAAAAAGVIFRTLNEPKLNSFGHVLGSGVSPFQGADNQLVHATKKRTKKVKAAAFSLSNHYHSE
jgi:hypothetical protein